MADDFLQLSANGLDKTISFQHALSRQSAAVFKQQPEDFRVTESLPFELQNSGEHLYLQIEKTLCTTLDVQRALCRWANVKPAAVAYAGLKDKWAQTRQWFSVHLPGRQDPIQPFDFQNCVILQRKRHNKKLRLGAHKLNQFEIVLREITDMQMLLTNLATIKGQGVPNYFGEQRFGYQRNNLDHAQQILLQGKKCSRDKKSLYLSALRSYLFNRLLAQRVAEQNWNQYLAGDILQLNGSKSCFIPDVYDAQLQQRLIEGDVHIAGLLPGVAGLQTTDTAHKIEQQVLVNYTAWLDYFSKIKLQAARRNLRVLPQNLTWQILDTQTLKLSFSLEAGSFATAVLRELIWVEAPLSYQQL